MWLLGVNHFGSRAKWPSNMVGKNNDGISRPYYHIPEPLDSSRSQLARAADGQVINSSTQKKGAVVAARWYMLGLAIAEVNRRKRSDRASARDA